MAQANDAEQPCRASGCTSVHSAEMIPTQHAELESKQAVTLLYIASQYIENETTTINVPVEVGLNNVDGFLILSLCSTELIREGIDGAAIVSSAENSVRVIKDKSVAMVDRRALSSLTYLLINANNFEETIPSSSRPAELGFNQVGPAIAKFRGSQQEPIKVGFRST